jgi:hypothetical protein
LGLLLLLFVLLVSLVAGCGAEHGSAAGPPSTGPAAFADESWAELASDGDSDLWLAVAGYERDGDFGLRVFRRGSPDWEELPRPPGEVSQNLTISIAVLAGFDGPCLGYSAGSLPAPVVTCFDGEDWQSIELPRLRGWHLGQIASHEGDLVALVDKHGLKASHFRLIRDTAGGWVSTPSVSAPPAIAQLAIGDPQGTTASFPGIGLATQGARAQHFVVELRDGRWQKLQPTLRGGGAGPFVGGPVLLEERVLYPVNEADSEPWSFSVRTARIGSATARGERLSTGAGNAQGSLDLAEGRVWATWQEHDPLEGGGFRTSIFAAELTPKGQLRRRVRLWRGVSIGPGSIQVVEFKGKTLALYMRASSNGRGLQATVKGIS